MVCKYFIPFWTFSFHFVDYFFCCLGTFLVWCSPTDLFLLCHLCLRCHYQKNHCQGIVKEMFPLCFLLWVLQFQVLYSAFNPFWVHFCRWCNLGVQFYFLHVVIQLSYTIHWRDYPFPIEYSWSNIYGFISELSILFHWCIYLLLCQYHTVWNTILCSIVWNQPVWCLQFCSSFSGLLIQGPLWFHVNFRIVCCIAVKKKRHWNFDRYCIEYINGFG